MHLLLANRHPVMTIHLEEGQTVDVGEDHLAVREGQPVADHRLVPFQVLMSLLQLQNGESARLLTNRILLTKSSM